MASDFTYQEEQIRELLLDLNKTFHDFKDLEEAYRDNEEEFELNDELERLEFVFKYDAKRLYLICIAYFEGKGLSNYINEYKKLIDPFFEDNRALLKGTYDNDTGEFFNNFTFEIEKVLSPFPRFNWFDPEFFIQKSGHFYLEHILESTSVIIKELNFIPKNEAQVYNSVKLVCKATFKDAQFPSESFQKTAKCYKPDILIPSLACAVEYKYAETEQKLIETIDQIIVDVKGYDKNPIYKIFYAVFYVKPGIWSQQRFQKVWLEKEFPINWKGKLIEGF